MYVSCRAGLRYKPEVNVKRSARFLFLIALLGTGYTTSRAGDPTAATEPGKRMNSSISNEAEVSALFDRWERVWHEGQYDLVAQCVQPNYIRHDEAGDRAITREAYARRLPRRGRNGPTYESLCMITVFKVTARGSALSSSGSIPKPVRSALGQECRRTGSRMASSRRPG
jgi:hypothetical protein